MASGYPPPSGGNEMILTDLHIHSCLSPCADDTMTPAAIVKAAKEAGLELIAITDHNSARNCPAVAAEAEKAGIGFIPGIEVTTSEEIHCVCLLPDLGKAAAFSRWLDTLRPGIANRPNVSGRQTVIGSRGSRTEERELLFMARRISVNELSRAVRQYSGLIWPAHVDKPSNSLYSILGCWPEDLDMDAVELYYDTEPAGIPESVHRLRCSDAPRLWDIKGGYPLPLESADFAGLKKYLRGE